MKKAFPVICAVLAGLITLVTLVFRSQLQPVLTKILQWGIVLASLATLVGILNLMLVHTRKIVSGNRGFFFSLIVLLGFLVSLVGGILLGVDNVGYLRWVFSIRIPLEVSLMGLLALVLTYTSFQFFKRKKWTPLSVSFFISVLVFMILSMGFVQSIGNPVVNQIIAFIQRLPIAGGRGILIGIALGLLLTGLRALLGAERPYGD